MTSGNNPYKELDKIVASEKRSFVYAFLIFIGFAVLILYLSSKYMFNDNDEPPPPLSKFGLYEPMLSFQKKYSRWPTDKTELEKFLTENKSDINLKPYQTIIFKPEKDGSVRIDYTFKWFRGTEQRTFVLSR